MCRRQPAVQCWYNVEHRHSAIRYITPAQRRAGQDPAILAARHALYTQARERHPARWARETATGPLWAPSRSTQSATVLSLLPSLTRINSQWPLKSGDNDLDARRKAVGAWRRCVMWILLLPLSILIYVTVG